jgi:hypothetical protein
MCCRETFRKSRRRRGFRTRSNKLLQLWPCANNAPEEQRATILDWSNAARAQIAKTERR